MCETNKSHVAQELLSYLARHPDAQDTLEGILEWWLLEEKIRRRAFEVKEALAELVRSGLLRERKGKDERVHYRVNRRRYEELTASAEPYAVKRAAPARRKGRETP
ncbi:MAG TPA: hypothetical protein VF297_24740 [Pyrinomonadaceae bacterium]